MLTTVLPANSWDFVPSKQLAVPNKETFCDPLSSSFILNIKTSKHFYNTATGDDKTKTNGQKKIFLNQSAKCCYILDPISPSPKWLWCKKESQSADPTQAHRVTWGRNVGAKASSLEMMQLLASAVMILLRLGECDCCLWICSDNPQRIFGLQIVFVCLAASTRWIELSPRRHAFYFSKIVFDSSNLHW